MKKIFLHALILITNLLINISILGQCHIDDWTALKALYKHADGENWNKQGGWDSFTTIEPEDDNCNLDDLYGVTVNAEGRVDTLILSNNQLNGKIPVEISKLSSLTYLSLSKNELSDSIPTELGVLNNLTKLYLYSNELSGSIPAELGNLNKLVYLYLYDNKLSGNIPAELSNLNRLEKLGLSSNQLTGSIPVELGNLISLTRLNLYNNDLSGNIPVELSNLTKLSELSLASNNLEGVIPAELGTLSNLTELYLSSNDLSGTIPIELGNLTELTILNLRSNELSGSIPVELGNLSKLSELYLYSNKLTGTIPIELGNLTELTILNLRSNDLSGSIPAELGNLSKLSELYLYNNELTGVYPTELFRLCDQLEDSSIDRNNNFEVSWDEFCALGDYAYKNICAKDDWYALKALYESTNGDSWKNRTGWDVIIDSVTTPPTDCNLRNLFGVEVDSFRVINLNLRINGLNGKIPVELGNLSNLKKMDLSADLFSSNLKGEIPPEIGNLTQLEYLNLSGNFLEGNIPEELGKLSNLTNLRLYFNQLSGNIPSTLGYLSKLTNLDLYFNKLSGSIPNSFGQLINLTSLDLHNNFLSGNIPSEFGNLINLENLDLWSNQLTGSIPAELGKTNLTSLALHDNQLSNSIPEYIGKLINLESLRLHNNQLSGNIPAKLGELANLKSLSLHTNQLSGNIPEKLGNLNELSSFNISKNYFTCTDIPDNFIQFAEKFLFYNTPQYYNPLNYDDIKSQVFDTLSNNQSLNLKIDFPFDTVGLSYQWYKNDEILQGATQATLNLPTVKPTDAGKYVLRVKRQSCFPDSSVFTPRLPPVSLIPPLPDGTSFETILSEGSTFESPSDPIYVIVKGYDLLGQPVEYDQIMVQFDNPDETKENEEEILSPNAGWVKKACNCNRELYLWEFPSTEKAAQALVEIDRKLKSGKRKSKIKGGFNNRLNVGEQSNSAKSFNVISDSLSIRYPDSATVYLLDSGLDHQNFNATPFLLNKAPIDSCYDIESASAYAFMNTDSIIPVSGNYKDDLWHGTFGFRSITDSLSEDNNIKIVPLKIFNEQGEGNLFDLTCAMYHSIDHNADVINISAGFSGQASQILENAILLAKEKGIFITAAVGNDSLNIDSLPQYPAWYANKYNTIEIIDENRNLEVNSIQYDHVISVVSLDESDNISQFSNFGEQSATIAAYGENIHNYGLAGVDVVASGTSMATYFVTKALALEIASNRNRTQKEIWKDFNQNSLINNNSIKPFTSTGKQLKIKLKEAVIYGCTDPNSCNYFEYVTIEDGSCEYNTCQCVYADWIALKKLYTSTKGNNWKRNENWDMFQLNAIPTNCNFDNLYGIQINNNGRVATINLYNNNLSGNLPKELKNLSELNSLYLAANNLTGEIPAEIGVLVYLENLILTANNLSGPIPIELGELSSLKRLYLSYNTLNGNIPTQLNQLTDLAYLLLNNNELEGKLPAELALLNNLYLLNVSNNQLNGCYDNDLVAFCNQSWSSFFTGNINISDGNYFDARWEDFCLNAEGICVENKYSNITPVEFKVHPNPSSGIIMVEFSCDDYKDKVVNIMNLQGKSLLRVEDKALSNHTYKLDLSGFSKGIYFIALKTEHNNYIQKFILN